MNRLARAFGDLYTDENVALMATHTHSGPGGYSHYTLYNLTTFGFDRQNFEAIVGGIYESIVRAHGNLAPGRIKIAEGVLPGASINRSRTAYLRNPVGERALYQYDTDNVMTLLRFSREDGGEVGTLNWFPVHGTSMGNDNRLISGDNKGYASHLFEKLKGVDYRAPRTFVAAFAQAAEGDSTPNIFGGTRGEGANDFESVAISGRKQFQTALELYNRASEVLTGGVSFRHTFVDLSRVTVAAAFIDGENSYTTDTAAIGFSMLAGAEDGPGFGWEGLTCESAKTFWPFLCDLVTRPGQGEKPVVLETGSLEPYPWTPEVLPVQVVRMGGLTAVALPFEVTTMAGRRLRATVESVLSPQPVYGGGAPATQTKNRVVVAGLSNAYAGYVTTREEYAVQHYEGASTHFGPWTLNALQQEVHRLASALRTGGFVEPGPAPRDLACCQTDFQPGVVFDEKPLFKSFGSVYADANASYRAGERARVVFWGGHPKNNLRIQGTFVEVQRLSGSTWVNVFDDGDPETKYVWQRKFIASSHVTIEWTIPQGMPPGTYRIRHYGDWKSGWDGKIRPYAGTSRSFSVR